MKIILINPPAINNIDFVREGRCEQRLSSFQYNMVPISLPSIAAVLIKYGHEVKIIDCIACKITPEKLNKLIAEMRPALGILNIATGSYNGDKIVVNNIKREFSFHLTAIGNHVTSLPDIVLKETKLDSVIIGEPEFIARELASCVDNKQPLSQVKGIAYRVDGKIFINERAPFIENLDDLPFPARSLLDNNKYFLPVINEPYTLLISSRGCPHNCIFCTAHQYYGRKLRLRSCNNILAEIDEIVNKHKIKNITMWSDTFTLNRDFVVSVCNGIIKNNFNIKWMCNSRVDMVEIGLLRLMKKSGCIGISYGIESGAQEILDNIRKKTTLLQAKNAIKWTKDAGIESLAHVILGLPGETKNTINKTIKFIKDIDPDYAQFYCAVPFPGTDFYQQAVKNSWIKSYDWDKYEINQAIIGTPQLSVAELEKSKIRAFRSFYLRFAYLVKRLSKVKSLSDLKMNFLQGMDFIRNWVLKS